MTDAPIVDPQTCARMAARLLAYNTTSLPTEALAWAQLGSLLLALRSSRADMAAHDVAHMVADYLDEPTDDHLARVHRSVLIWRQEINRG